MADRLDYLVPTQAILLVECEEGFTNLDVFEYFDENDLEYEADEEAIRTAYKNEMEDGTELHYHVHFIPEENRIRAWSEEHIDANHLVNYVLQFEPEIIERDELVMDTMYNFGIRHPGITIPFLANLIPEANWIDHENQLPHLEYTYADSKFYLYTDYDVVSSAEHAETFHEFAAHLNDRIHQSLDPEPTHLSTDFFPDGWLSPTIASHPVFDREFDQLRSSAAMASTVDRIDDYPGIEFLIDTDEVERSNAVDDLVELTGADITPNDIVVGGLDTVATVLYTVNQLNPDERREFAETHQDDDGIFGGVVENIEDEGDLLNFCSTPIWTKELEEQFNRDRMFHLELKDTAHSYGDIDLVEGDEWLVSALDVDTTLTVELTERQEISDVSYPHLPVWMATIKEGDTSSIPQDIGDEVPIHGEQFIEQQ